MQNNEALIAALQDAVFRCSIPLRWGDMDAMRHVNNAVYFRFFEEARMRMLDNAQAVDRTRRGFVLAHTSCDFLRPLVYPGSVVVVQIIRRVGRSSFALDAVIEREDEPGVAYAKGHYVVVGVDLATGRSMPWLEGELERLAKAVNPAEVSPAA